MSKGKRREAARRRPSSRRQKPRNILVIIIIVVAVILVAVFCYHKYGPSGKRADVTEYYGLSQKNAVMVIMNNEKLDNNAIMENGHVYIPIQEVQSSLNNRFFWDNTEGILRYVNGNHLISTEAVNTRIYTVDKKRHQADCTIAVRQNSTMYLSLDFIKKYSNIRAKTYTNPDRVVLSDKWGKITWRTLKKDTSLRTRGGNRSSVVGELKKGTLVNVSETYENWVGVTTEDGLIGYIRKNTLGGEKTVTQKSSFKAARHTRQTRNFTVDMAWHQVTNTAANGNIEKVLSSAKGVNVIAPTWYYLKNDRGGIVSLASDSYVEYCHKHNVEVWGLVSNLEKKVNTAQVLNVTSSRDRLINRLVAQAIAHDLDGINVDFESLGNETGYGFIEFIRELSVKCAANGIVLSVDNYPPSSYTNLYYRDEQAEYADYVIVMAYDEHYSGSDAGPVASISYVRSSIKDTLKNVPAKQLILGIPFYTRLWRVEKDENGQEQTTCVSVGMAEAERRIKEAGTKAVWKDSDGCAYAEWSQDQNVTYRIWLENNRSIRLKLDVMKKNNLAGCAFWKLGYEKSGIWKTVDQYVS